MIADKYIKTIMCYDNRRKKYYPRKPELVFGNKPQDIEGYQEAISSDELYVAHHKLEKEYTSKELKEMKRYYKVPSNELVWLPYSYHNGNTEIHKGCIFTKERIEKSANSHKGLVRSEFGRKFKEHFGINRQDNITLYKIEHKFYKKHGKCRWEV